MLDRLRGFLWAQVRAIKPAFVSKKPHFNFISAHYTWIVTCTLIASIAIYAAGGGISYIDSLLLASGANTQAGLNPVDLNALSTFQQIVIYIFTMMSNPITLHGSVVFLRLYWFEKRFQGWVTDARTRRATISKSKSRALSNDPRSTEEGVNGRNITVLHRPGDRPQRMTNDGILLGSNEQVQSQAIDTDDEDAAPKCNINVNSDESDTTTVTGARSNSIEPGPLDKPDAVDDGQELQAKTSNGGLPQPTAISFADTVKRSDGVDDETKFPQWRSNDEHIAILERQRNQDNEVLRIPGPRESERGMIPRRLDYSDPQEYEDALAMTRTRDLRPEQGDSEPERPASVVGSSRPRRPTIVIAEPERPKRDGIPEQVAQDTRAVGSTLEALRFRKPRILNSGQKTVHEDEEHSTTHRPFRARTVDTFRSILSREKSNDMPYLSYTPTIGRNSNFMGLTLEQREELGGIEYRSLRTLALVLTFYFWGFHAMALICMLPFILYNNIYGAVVDKASVSRVWWAFFTSNSAFMDLGLTLTPDSMNSFNTSDYTMVIMWFFIIIGNTGFPVMLRFVIWVAASIVPKRSGLWEELRFLLDHPRRCFTLLFPGSATWWLFWILVALNLLDLVFFIALDFNTGPIAQVAIHTRIADGLFQAAATRTAGFSCYSMTDLAPAMPVLYMIMMYISVFPIAISIRRTNVYEEKSLGVYGHKDDDEDTEASALSYVGTHLRRQLSFDLWYVFVGFFFLAISEGSKLKRGDFHLFDILFEVVSAYGTVGLSIGVPNVNASLCSQFSVVGKLIIIAMQIRGRHRGLPYGLDRAVLLPSESRFKSEAEDNQLSLGRTRTAISTGTTSGFERDRRGSSTGRARSSSRGRGRESANSRIITSFLHPGPAINKEATLSHRRNHSGESNNVSFGRANTEPLHEESEEEDEVGPLHHIQSQNGPRRAETAPVH